MIMTAEVMNKSNLSEKITNVIEKYGTHPDYLESHQVKEFLNDTYYGMGLEPMSDKEFDEFMFAVDENKDGVIEHRELIKAFDPMLKNLQIMSLKNGVGRVSDPGLQNSNLKSKKAKGNNSGFISGLGASIKKFERKKSIHRLLVKGHEFAKDKINELGPDVTKFCEENAKIPLETGVPIFLIKIFHIINLFRKEKKFQ